MNPDAPSPFFHVGDDRVRHLRNGEQAFPAMLAAIDAARSEIVLEMYWVGDDAVGRLFRDRLTARAEAGIVVRVVFDAVGSFGLPGRFWAPLVAAGGHVAMHGTLAPWRRRFRFARIRFRDHRKLLVVDGAVAFCGGINLAAPWLPRDAGGEGWRDDSVEIHGTTAIALRDAACEAWRERASVPRLVPKASSGGPPRRITVLVNRTEGKPSLTIRRAYLAAIRGATRSIDIASAYFLPGPLFLLALRAAVQRGVRVRVLVPKRSDVWIVGMAMIGVLDALVRDDVEVHAYGATMLHCKTAILDDRVVVTGSHNLDTLSWRFNLEANVMVADAAFATAVCEAYENDLALATRLTKRDVGRRSIAFRLIAWFLARFRWLL